MSNPTPLHFSICLLIIAWYMDPSRTVGTVFATNMFRMRNLGFCVCVCVCVPFDGTRTKTSEPQDMSRAVTQFACQ
jgi:hypothetical protein